VQGIKCKATRI